MLKDLKGKRWQFVVLSVTIFSCYPLIHVIPAQAAISSLSDWSGDVFPNQNLSGPPLMKTDDATFPALSDLNFNGGSNTPGGINSSNFSARFTKKVSIDQGGKYLFQTTANDGVRVYLQNLDNNKIEETNSSISYSPTPWQVYSNPNNSNGSAYFSEDPSANLTFSFTGTSAKVVGYKSGWYGIADVYIDGNKVGSIDYYGASTQYQQVLFQKSGLTSGSHVLKLVNTGTRNPSAIGNSINIDYLQFDTGSNLAPNSTGDVAYSGNWLTFQSSQNSGGSAKYTDNNGAYVSMNFTGTSVTIKGYKSIYYGIGDVYIDGNKVGSIDYYSPSTQYQQNLFHSSDLPFGTHSIKIIRTGTKNPLASSANINVDAIQVGDGLGRVEDTGPSISYTGSWSTFNTSSNSGGAAKYSNSSDANVTITFTGSSVKFGGYKSIYYGMADVYLDNQKVGIIDYYNPTTIYQQSLFALSGLSNTTHTLKVIRTGDKNPHAISNNINIDFVDIGDGSGSFEESTLNAIYNGTWGLFSSPSNSGGMARYSEDPGASVILPFSGTSVKLSGYKSSYYGIADVYIDGNKMGSIDYYSPITQYQLVLFQTSGLTNGQHTLKIVKTGTKNLSATGTAINLDGIQVNPPLWKYEEQNAGITYTGSWQTFATSSNSGGTAKYTDTSAASASFSFTGGSLKIVGYRAVYYGIADVFIDGVKTGTIDFYSPYSQYQQTLFEKRSLSNGTHTVKIVATGNKNVHAIGTTINLDYFSVSDGSGIFEEIDGNASALNEFFNKGTKTIVLDSWHDNSGSVGNTAYLAAGTYQIYVEYYNNLGPADLSFQLSDIPTRVPDRPSPYGPDFYKSSNGNLVHYLGNPSSYSTAWSVGSAPGFMVDGRIYVRDADHNFFWRTDTEDYYAGTYVPPFESLNLKLPAKVTAQDINQYFGTVSFRYEESSPYVSFSGAWAPYSNPNLSSGNANYTGANAAAVTVEFAGPSISIYGYKAPYYGKGIVYIDGKYASTIDFYNSSTIYQQLVFKETGLSNSDHTLQIVPSSTGTYINFDYAVAGSPLNGHGQDFIDAQNQYGVNAQYLMAHAIHETGWGTSKIMHDKHNLFGYHAYDSDPYGSASYFPSIKDSIVFEAYIVRKNYLTPGGAYYNGPNLDGMNVRYATDPDWAEKISNIMLRMRPYNSTDYANVSELPGNLNVPTGPTP